MLPAQDADDEHPGLLRLPAELFGLRRRWSDNLENQKDTYYWNEKPSHVGAILRDGEHRLPACCGRDGARRRPRTITDSDAAARRPYQCALSKLPFSGAAGHSQHEPIPAARRGREEEHYRGLTRGSASAERAR